MTDVELIERLRANGAVDPLWRELAYAAADRLETLAPSEDLGRDVELPARRA